MERSFRYYNMKELNKMAAPLGRGQQSDLSPKGITFNTMGCCLDKSFVKCKGLTPVILIWVVTAGLSFSFSSQKEPSSGFDSVEKLNHWMSHYYLNRDSSRVVPAIRSMFRYGLFDNESRRLPLEAFLGSVFYQNHQRVGLWLRELEDLSLEEKKVLWTAVRFSRSPQGQRLLERVKTQNKGEAAEFISRLIKEEKKPLLEVEISSPVILDMLWAQFLASGDERCVKRVMDALPFFEESKDAEKVLIGAAAKWSLTSNAIQHKRVLDICKYELPSRPESVKASLMEIIQKAEADSPPKRR